MSICAKTVHWKQLIQLLRPFKRKSTPTFVLNYCYTRAASISTNSTLKAENKPATGASKKSEPHALVKEYPPDEWTTVSPKVLSYLGRNLHLDPYHPLCHVKRRIVDFTYKYFPRCKGGKSPLFTVVENLSPIVTVEQNFDSLLVPQIHPSRSKSDSYYFNSKHLLRAHTSAHQSELIASGLSNFLVIGDVYRRDEIDRTHYPVFHQVEGVRLVGSHEIFQENSTELKVFEKAGVERSPEKQEFHTTDAVMVMTQALKSYLEGLAHHLFGKGEISLCETSNYSRRFN